MIVHLWFWDASCYMLILNLSFLEKAGNEDCLHIPNYLTIYYSSPLQGEKPLYPNFWYSDKFLPVYRDRILIVEFPLSGQKSLPAGSRHSVGRWGKEGMSRHTSSETSGHLWTSQGKLWKGETTQEYVHQCSVVQGQTISSHYNLKFWEKYHIFCSQIQFKK